METPSTEDIVNRYKKLVSQHKEVSDNYTLVNSELQARKNSLKRLMDEVREEGFDPNNLESEVRRMTEVVRVKLNTFSDEIETAKKIIDPMIKEIKGA
jgi:archaellum component FlaC